SRILRAWPVRQGPEAGPARAGPLPPASWRRPPRDALCDGSPERTVREHGPASEGDPPAEAIPGVGREGAGEGGLLHASDHARPGLRVWPRQRRPAGRAPAAPGARRAPAPEGRAGGVASRGRQPRPTLPATGQALAGGGVVPQGPELGSSDLP